MPRDLFEDQPKASGLPRDLLAESNPRNGNLQSGGETAFQGATLGFGDELAGLGGAIAGKAFNLLGLGDNKTFAEDYRTIRDKYRGDVAGFAKDNPKSALALQIAGSLPTALAATPMAIGAGVVPQTINAVKIGSGYGAVSGLGGSTAEDLGGMATDTLKGAAYGAVGAGVTQPIMSGIGAVGSNVAQRFNINSAEDAAKVKLAEALQRGVRGEADPYLQAQARMGKLGPNATIADVGDATRGSLDLMASMPGNTETAVNRIIRERQAGRSELLRESADKALGTQGAKASDTINKLVEDRATAARPLYAQVENAPIPVDQELLGLLNASSKFHGAAQDMALVRQEINIGDKLIDGTLGATVSLKHLDQLKRTLYDAAQAKKNAGELGAASDINELRQKLIAKLDDASPKDQMGNSIYKQARDAFAGPSELKGAVEAGRNALKEGAEKVYETTAGMTQSELDHYRIGALQAIRDKVGSQSGITQVLNMWKNPNTKEPLKAIFGDDFKKFARDVYKVEELKKMDAIGKGSQTFKRMAGAEDSGMLPAVGDVGSAVANAKTGNLLGMAGAIGKAYTRTTMPENTRNALGGLLLKKGAEGQAELNNLAAFMRARANKGSPVQGSIAAELGYQFNK